jgi:hypothetical protein
MSEQRPVHLTMGRFSLSFLQILIWAATALGVAAAAPTLAWSQNAFGGTGTVFVPYANATTNAKLAVSPSVNVGFDSSGHYTQFIMDTGSVGIVATQDTFQPAPEAQNLGPGQQYYSSSGNIENGTWWSSTENIYDASGKLVATADVPVLQVTSRACAPNARSCRPSKHPTGVALMGIGFARESPQQPRGIPAYNAFLNLTSVATSGGAPQPLPAGWRNGYVVTASDIYLGLDAANTQHAGFVKLQPNPAYSTPTLPEWMPAPMTVSVNGVSGTGTVLMDTGVGSAYLTPPIGSSVGPLAACQSTGLRQCAPNGTAVTLYLPDQSAPLAVYSFVVGQSGNPLRPDGVVMVNGSAVFLNTSRHFLGGLDLIYDEAVGFVGYRWTGNASGARGGVNAAAGVALP